MSPALMMSKQSLRRITARLHIHHIMNKVMRVLHYAGSCWTSDTYLVQFLKRYRKGEMRQTFFSIFQVTAYFLLIIISFKLVILLRFLEHSELNKFVIIAGFQEGLAPITSLTVCHIIEDQLLFIFIFRELQQPVIHDIELAFEPPIYIRSFIVGGSKKVSSDGFAYTVKRENFEKNTSHWRCTSRAKRHCPASVIHTIDDDEEYFHQSYADHIHPAKPMLLMTVKARKEMTISINVNSK